jgi:hypothetical protein
MNRHWIVILPLAVLITATFTFPLTVKEENHESTVAEQFQIAERHLYRHELTFLMALIKSNPFLLDHITDSGETLLGIAAYRGYVRAVQQLLDSGANPNTGLLLPIQRAIEGYILYGRGIRYAASSQLDYIRILSLLLESSANLDSMIEASPNLRYSLFEELVMSLCRASDYSEAAIEDLIDRGLTFFLTPAAITPTTRHILSFSAVSLEYPEHQVYVPSCVHFFYDNASISHTQETGEDQ